MYQSAKFIHKTKVIYQNTIKMKITVNKFVQETHELELPAYKKNSIYFYKILSEKETVQICIAKGSESISNTYTSLAFSQATTESNQVEFDQQFNEVFTIITEKING